MRLHFFDETVNYDQVHTDITCQDGRLEGHYFGYIVLRPTLSATLGRSMLSPNIRVTAHGKAIQSIHHVNVLGYPLHVWGFPSMSQPADIACCAHVACWAILRHYSVKFPQYREHLIHDVVSMASTFDPGGLVPSLGLTVRDAESIFQSADCFPLMIAKKPNSASDGEYIDHGFYAQLLAYLESGFPLFIEIQSRQHAVVAVGYDWTVGETVSQHGSDRLWGRVESLIVVDDNELPYLNISPDLSSKSLGSDTYTYCEIDRFIVALPEKIHYSAEAVDALSTSLSSILKDEFAVGEERLRLRRFFLTSISEVRTHTRTHESQMGNALVRLVMELASAQYVWVVEFCSSDQWNTGHVSARAIVDATASTQDPLAVLLIHDERLAIVFDRLSGQHNHRVVDLSRSAGLVLPRMELNLRTVAKS